MSLSTLVRDSNGVAEHDGNQYLHGLVDEKHVSSGGVIKPAIPLPTVRRKGRNAKRLAKLTGDKLNIYYDPASFLDDDRSAQGHLYSGFWNTDSEEEFIRLDDRDGALEDQLVAECRRVAKLYSDIADGIEAGRTVAHA
jgi:hypothetical protein